MYEACVAYGVPLISGKDSMKNDAFIGGTKISIPPTLLVSVMGQIDDVGKALDPVLVAGSDLWLLGETRSELDARACCAGAARATPARCAGPIPRGCGRATAFAALVADGRSARKRVGAVARWPRGGAGSRAARQQRGDRVALDAVAPNPIDALFSESTGRILLSSAPADRARVQAQLEPFGLVALERAVAQPPELRGTVAGASWLQLPEPQLRAVDRGGASPSGAQEREAFFRTPCSVPVPVPAAQRDTAGPGGGAGMVS
ncbi:MAG: hypothetical protein U0168_06450 [Nannocystaceae bacterium]